MAGETTIHSPDPDFLNKTLYDFWCIRDLLINSVTGITMWVQVLVLISVSVEGHVEAFVDGWSDKQCPTEGARKPAWFASSQHRNNPVTAASTTSISVSQLSCIFKQHCLSNVMLEGRSQFGMGCRQDELKERQKKNRIDLISSSSFLTPAETSAHPHSNCKSHPSTQSGKCCCRL